MIRNVNQNNDEPYFCSEQLADCLFRLAEYKQDSEFLHERTLEHCLIYCQRGYLKIASNLFVEETLCEGEVMFLPRMNDYQGVVQSDAVLLIHTFNNTVCRPEQCLLSYLYIHKQTRIGKAYCHCKLMACESMMALFNAAILYIKDGKSDHSVWKTKHMELIWVFTHYYSMEELRSFFHPMTDEEVPFKSLVLAHYRKAEFTDKLAEMCGSPLHTFRRMFKAEFGISPYKWLTQKRAEHVRHRLSFHYIPFNDIIDEFHFSSAAHFCNFCKQFLGDTPTNLRKTLSEKHPD